MALSSQPGYVWTGICPARLSRGTSANEMVRKAYLAKNRSPFPKGKASEAMLQKPFSFAELRMMQIDQGGRFSRVSDMLALRFDRPAQVIYPARLDSRWHRKEQILQ